MLNAHKEKYSELTGLLETAHIFGNKKLLFYNPMKTKSKFQKKGFTLVELLIVIAIIVSLAALIVAGTRKAILKSQKVSCLNTMRSVGAGLQAYISDRNVPPLPVALRTPEGIDTVFGSPTGQYPNDYLVAVLEGEDKSFTYGGDPWLTSEVNPNFEEYVKLARTPDKKNGVYDKPGDQLSGRLYDPWGRMLMIAVNVPPYIEVENGGKNDKLMFTDGLTTYPDTRPHEESFVIWSYGKDGVKGTAGKNPAANPYRSSDDVISW